MPAVVHLLVCIWPAKMCDWEENFPVRIEEDQETLQSQHSDLTPRTRLVSLCIASVEVESLGIAFAINPGPECYPHAHRSTGRYWFLRCPIPLPNFCVLAPTTACCYVRSPLTRVSWERNSVCWVPVRWVLHPLPWSTSPSSLWPHLSVFPPQLAALLLSGRKRSRGSVASPHLLIHKLSISGPLLKRTRPWP